MITHSRETYQPTSIMRWDRGIFNGSKWDEDDLQRFQGVQPPQKLIPHLMIQLDGPWDKRAIPG